MARIILISKFYYPRGGDCIAVLMLEELLKKHGHEVALFSSQYEQNLPSPWDAYFPSAINFSHPSIGGKIKAASRLFYSEEVKRKFNRLLEDFKPDIIHAHNIHSYLSPYVVQLAASKGIKVVWTMHDYKLICPAYSCLRDGKPCELCFTDKRPVITHACMKGSKAASLLAYFEAKVWNRKVLEKYTDTFISPSLFLKSKMVQAGFDQNKITVLPNFMNAPSATVETNKSDYYCYLGRLSYEKGIDSLLEAAKDLPYTLKVMGSGEKKEEYKKIYKDTPIEFLDYMPNQEALDILRKARFSVMPSICYDNNPISVIESLCMGTPVVGANIGGIPELIEEGRDGFLFTPGDVAELKQKITESFRIFDPAYPYEEIANAACAKFSAETFYEQIKKIYDIQE